jgi:hypothetical protein
MHCGAKMQLIMAQLFQEILQDIFVVNPEKPPDKYPSPADCKGMFIIKEGRPRILLKQIQRSNTIEDKTEEMMKEGLDEDGYEYDEYSDNDQIIETNDEDVGKNVNIKINR